LDMMAMPSVKSVGSSLASSSFCAACVSCTGSAYSRQSTGSLQSQQLWRRSQHLCRGGKTACTNLVDGLDQPVLFLQAVHRAPDKALLGRPCSPGRASAGEVQACADKPHAREGCQAQQQGPADRGAAVGPRVHADGCCWWASLPPSHRVLDLKC
jgi:hypothetical protein